MKPWQNVLIILALMFAMGAGGTGIAYTYVANTFTANQTISGASFGLSGNISAPAWTTSGIRYANVSGTLTDTSSSGTVATAYSSVFSGSTIAASSATTYTDYFGAYFKAPVAGTNVTITNIHALGADSLQISGVSNFGEAHGTTETVTLTSNNYNAVVGDCGKVKLLPTGTTPTVTLPNINPESGSCTIVFVTTAAKSYLFNVAAGGSKQNSQGFYNTRGTAAGDTVDVILTVPSASAATWNISGDVTS